MSRFADPRRTATLVLPGGCQCPGSPHADDEWTYRTELGDSEIKQAGARAATNEPGDLGINVILMQDLLLEVASVRWNLVDEAGAVPLDAKHLRLLDAGTRDAMLTALDEATSRTLSPPPNRSAARSRNGSRASGSQTRTPTKGG